MISNRQICIIMVCVGLAIAEICLPDDNTYYNPQLGMCAKCDSCLRGLGKDTVKVNEKIKWDQEHGALTCTPCILCSNGFYNDRRDFDCKPCNNCSQQNRYEIEQCTSISDVTCGSIIKTEHPVTGSLQANPTSLKIKEFHILITLVVTTVGSCLVIASVLLCFIYQRRRYKSKDGSCTMNNNIECNDSMQRVPLVVVDNRSSTSPSNKDEDRTYDVPKKQSTIINIPTSSNTISQQLSPGSETTPKVVASNNDQNREIQCNSEVSSNNQCSSIKEINSNKFSNNCAKIHSPLLCCAAILDSSIDDVSKSSLSTGGSPLVLDTFLSERNDKSVYPETCMLKRSNCSILSNGSMFNHDKECSPSYFCKCYDCSNH
ncbi:uncharacterized protein LOC143085597 isoform X1 [Mytilus galloprovincialis]|uniref:uncharacterized protein LOC143085597 isoform X1 n=1 Tax=Mytilus galloprovincialis TaxID=29158 RepID=UPI003F7CC28C